MLSIARQVFGNGEELHVSLCWSVASLGFVHFNKLSLVVVGLYPQKGDGEGVGVAGEEGGEDIGGERDGKGYM